MKELGKTPCKSCENRDIYCHVACEKYQKYCKIREKMREERHQDGEYLAMKWDNARQYRYKRTPKSLRHKA